LPASEKTRTRRLSTSLPWARRLLLLARAPFARVAPALNPTPRRPGSSASSSTAASAVAARDRNPHSRSPLQRRRTPLRARSMPRFAGALARRPGLFTRQRNAHHYPETDDLLSRPRSSSGRAASLRSQILARQRGLPTSLFDEASGYLAITDPRSSTGRAASLRSQILARQRGLPTSLFDEASGNLAITDPRSSTGPANLALRRGGRRARDHRSSLVNGACQPRPSTGRAASSRSQILARQRGLPTSLFDGASGDLAITDLRSSKGLADLALRRGERQSRDHRSSQFCGAKASQNTGLPPREGSSLRGDHSATVQGRSLLCAADGAPSRGSVNT